MFQLADHLLYAHTGGSAEEYGEDNVLPFGIADIPAIQGEVARYFRQQSED